MKTKSTTIGRGGFGIASRIKALVAVTLALASSLATSAALKWTGKYSSNWNTTEYNFVNESGDEALFTSSSVSPVDVIFDDSAVRKTVLVAEGGAAIYAGNVVVSNETSVYTFTNTASAQCLMSVVSFRKKGAARLDFRSGGGQVIRDFGDGLYVEKGEFAFYNPGSLGRYATKETGVLFVGADATLRLGARNIYNSGYFDRITTPTEVHGGTLALSDVVNGQCKIGPVLFDNGTFDYSGLNGYNQTLGVANFSGKLTFRGDTPYYWLQSGFSTEGSPKTKLFGLWDGEGTEFDVADITGDEAPDLVIGAKLGNHATNNVDTAPTLPGVLVKSGAGTLALTNSANTFSGNIEVRGGTLQAGPDWVQGGPAAWLGASGVERTITVKSGAKLYLTSRNLFGNMNGEGKSGITNGTALKLSFVFDGGVLSGRAGEAFLMPDMTFANGGSIAPDFGMSAYGRFMVKEHFRVTGNAPFRWPLKAYSSVDQLAGQGLSLNGYPENVFDVEDATGDSDVDAYFDVPFIIGRGFFRKDVGNHQLSDWAFGFTKTGAGTMRMSAPSVSGSEAAAVSGLAYRSFNGDAKVNAGTLQVDGDISLSDTVRVAAGAYLAGTGTVNNVALAAGGGLRVSHRQADPLVVKGDFAAAGPVTVAIDLPVGAAARDIRASVLTVEGGLTGGANISGATVLVNGEALPAVKISLSGKTVSLRYRRGTTLVFR